MAKPKAAKSKKMLVPKRIADALKRFPKVVRLQQQRAIERQRFLKETFGDLVKQLKKLRGE